MMGFAERFREEGMQQGMRQGIDQGVKLGEATLLRALLEKRFGTLPDRADQKLNGSTTRELELWAERILDAENLDTFFD